MEIELWCDSFHEGQWACKEIGREIESRGGVHVEKIVDGFIPTHNYSLGSINIEVVVYGSYGAWAGIPSRVKDLLDWGKPDLICYAPTKDAILFAVEETAATPTGNQALQRCERQFGSALSGIPFWYLLSEFGLHGDGGIRTDSIWPTITALKLTQNYLVPSVVLHYSSSSDPEDYSVGVGVTSLFSALTEILVNAADGRPELDNLEKILEAQYAEMCKFVERQWSRQITQLPGVEKLSEPDVYVELSELACGSLAEAKLTKSLLEFPTTRLWHKAMGSSGTSGQLIKHDKFAFRLEADTGANRCYVLSNRTGARPQKLDSVKTWIGQQQKLFSKGPVPKGARFEMGIEDFPVTSSGNVQFSTSPNIVYLYDRWHDVLDAIEECFPRLVGILPRGDSDDSPGMVYLSNSLKPGRLFGDPYTGQMAAFATSLGRFADKPRRVLAYFPHQVHTQVKSGNATSGKGLYIYRTMVDLMLFQGGVAIDMSTDAIL